MHFIESFRKSDACLFLAKAKWYVVAGIAGLLIVGSFVMLSDYEALKRIQYRLEALLLVSSLTLFIAAAITILYLLRDLIQTLHPVQQRMVLLCSALTFVIFALTFGKDDLLDLYSTYDPVWMHLLKQLLYASIFSGISVVAFSSIVKLIEWIRYGSASFTSHQNKEQSPGRYTSANTAKKQMAQGGE